MAMRYLNMEYSSEYVLALTQVRPLVSIDETGCLFMRARPSLDQVRHRAAALHNLPNIEIILRRGLQAGTVGAFAYTTMFDPPTT